MGAPSSPGPAHVDDPPFAPPPLNQLTTASPLQTGRRARARCFTPTTSWPRGSSTPSSAMRRGCRPPSSRWCPASRWGAGVLGPSCPSATSCCCPPVTAQRRATHQQAAARGPGCSCRAPARACPQVQDNSRGGSQGEIQLTLINLTGQTIPAGSQQITFSLAVGTLGTP
jgi:hypothetical protein